MNRLAMLIRPLLGMALLALLLGRAGPAWASEAWHVVPSPNAGTGNSQLNGVVAISPSDAWAVGSPIEHYDGTRWSVVPSPNAGLLNAVAAVSAGDVWAVGNYGYGSGTLIEHYDGTRWSVAPSPSPGAFQDSLFGVTALSASDVWAVGSYRNASGAQKTLIEHYNGTGWSVVYSPNVGIGDNQLNGVTALSAGDVWAVGNSCAYPGCANDSGSGHTLIEHYDGTRWSVAPSPGTFQNSLFGVTALSASDVWAVGFYRNGNYVSQTLIEHYDGTSWSVFPNSSGRGGGNLFGVTALSAGDIWAVGNNGVGRTLIEHYNGAGWSIVASPNVGTSSNGLNGVTATSATDIWAVGAYVNASGAERTLIEHPS